MKRLFSKIINGKVYKIVAPIVRANAKVILPPAVPVIEILKNVVVIAKNRTLAMESKPVQRLPHSWLSIGTQVVLWALIIYAFTAKVITIEQAVELIKSFLF